MTSAARWLGYCSDITRCVFTGDRRGGRRGLRGPPRRPAGGRGAAVVGTPCEEVDGTARRSSPRPARRQFIHRTGHGIGIEEHEDPYIVSGNANALAPGHAFSIEPGIYVEGRFGSASRTSWSRPPPVPIRSTPSTTHWSSVDA